VELIGVGELGRQRAARDVAGQGRQGAGACVRHQRVLVEIVVQDGPDFPGPQLCRQAVSNPDCLGEQLVLRPEMGIEGAARQPRSQHDVVDVGAGMATQPEQPGGMVEDFGAGAGLASGADGHRCLKICQSTYDMLIDIS